MTRKTVSFRLPESIIQAIEAHAKATGKTRTTLIVEVLSQAYGLPQPSPPQVTTEMLQQQIDELKQQVATLATGKFYVLAEGEQSGNAQNLIARIESQAKAFDQILLALPDPLFICDRQGRITYINLTGAQMLKIKRSQALGKNYQQVNLPQDVLARLQPQMEWVLMNGQFIRGEFTLQTSSQTRHYEFLLNPIFGGEGVIDGILGIARDTTRYKQTEAELRYSQEQHRNLFELANDLMFIIDASTDEIVEVNSQALKRLGYTGKEIYRQSFCDISPPEAAAHYKAAIVPELGRMGGGIFEHTLCHRNGQAIWVEISSRLIEYQGRLAFVCSARDLLKIKNSAALSPLFP